jgi:cardiolipin synthase A/B
VSPEIVEVIATAVTALSPVEPLPADPPATTPTETVVGEPSATIEAKPLADSPAVTTKEPASVVPTSSGGSVPSAFRSVSFSRGLWRLASADVSSGNRVELLRDGGATFKTMLELIDGARTSVALEGYIFRHDDVGQRFAAALGAAAERGVAVRLLVDWVGRMGTSRAFFDKIRSKGAEVRIFNVPFHSWYWLGLLPRDHRKVLVVDNGTGVTGGIGIGNEWRTGVLKRRRSPWRDTAVRIDGPAADDMRNAFDRMWRRAEGRERRGVQRLMTRRSRGAHLDPSTDPPALVGIVEGEPGRFRVARALQIQAVSAERYIWIASAYFAPSYSEVEALNGAARDGVDVRVLVPSRYDHPWIRRFTRQFYRRLLLNGVRIWEWSGEMMHAKTMVSDGRWIRVGSTDFNPLGVAVNFELDAVIEDRKTGAEAEAMFEADIEQSREIHIR